jgi:hypothetical protein
VRESFAKQPLARRIAALAVAYIFALSGIIGSFSAAATAGAAVESGLVTCHGSRAGEQTPAGGQPNGMPCDNSCCIGCVSALAALPPPPTTSVAIERTQGPQLAAPATVELPFDPQVRSHQSRGPPRNA